MSGPHPDANMNLVDTCRCISSDSMEEVKEKYHLTTIIGQALSLELSRYFHLQFQTNCETKTLFSHFIEN